MADLNDLARYLSSAGTRIAANTSAAAVAVANTILMDLSQVTPVDQGIALSNWQVSLDEPNLEVISAYVPSPRGKYKNGVWTHSVEPSDTMHNNAPAMLEAGKAILQEKTAGQPIYISNSTDHIVPLDQGHSTQQPAGFVNRAVILGRLVIEKASLLR